MEEGGKKGKKEEHVFFQEPLFRIVEGSWASGWFEELDGGSKSRKRTTGDLQTSLWTPKTKMGGAWTALEGPLNSFRGY